MQRLSTLEGELRMTPARSPRRSRALRALAFGVGLSALAGVTACGSEDGSPNGTRAGIQTPGDAADSGSLSFALTVPPGLTFDRFSYAVTGPNFSKADFIDVTHSGTVSAVIASIPSGDGYSVTLAGTSTDPDASCSGSSTFSISAGVKTTVPVDVACRLVQPQVVASVPVPGSSSAVLGLVLLGVGAVVLRRRTL